jgi:hypothetical protein
MKKIICLFVGIALLCMVNIAFSQTVEAYEDKTEESKTGLLDPSRFSVNHSVSFGMASSSQYSGLKSQSLYTTMMTYKFSKPVTLDLNFGLPIHSTFSSAHNLNQENLQSMDYFKNMPLSAFVTWQPTENLAIQVGVMRNTGAAYYHNPYSLFSPYSPYGSMFQSHNRRTDADNDKEKSSKKEKE